MFIEEETDTIEAMERWEPPKLKTENKNCNIQQRN